MRAAVPRSGWRAMKATGTMRISAPTAKSLNPRPDSLRWKYHASIIGSASFIISEGWKRVTPTCNQRDAEADELVHDARRILVGGRKQRREPKHRQRQDQHQHGAVDAFGQPEGEAAKREPRELHQSLSSSVSSSGVGCCIPCGSLPSR